MTSKIMVFLVGLLLGNAPAYDEVERARWIVDDATARGVWTAADRAALREELAAMQLPL